MNLDDYYQCAECDQPIEGDDVDRRHTTTNGADCHESCCPICEGDK